MSQKGKFSLPLFGWILAIVIVIVVITYFDLIYIVQSIRLLESSNGSDTMLIFLKILLFLSALKILSLGLIIKGKRIGVWCLGGVFMSSILIIAADSQGRASFLAFVGLATFLYFKYTVANSENHYSLSISSTQ